ncbi:MAG: hypothetical protein LBF88_09950 [Planctomycetaceae bacterium]|jgi:hypothetical protein|nr:hypothetical protein [Planctomycetaceae bacterium]
MFFFFHGTFRFLLTALNQKIKLFRHFCLKYLIYPYIVVFLPINYLFYLFFLFCYYWEVLNIKGISKSNSLDGTGHWLGYEIGAANTSSHGLGLHLYGNNNIVTQQTDLLSIGRTGGGIRVDGFNNKVIVDQNTKVYAIGMPMEKREPVYSLLLVLITKLFIVVIFRQTAKECGIMVPLWE